jgi:valyl-tRNA synthetase
MADELANSYNPNDFEEEIYNNWQEKGYFNSEVNPAKKPYTIVIPPPNVTGMLHMGHVLNNTIQDILIRYHRMRGYETLWVPGTDHASIATEAKVAKMLADKGIDKFSIGREKFLEYAQDWKTKYGGIIISQLKRLGSSCDWRRERFTMDDGYYKAVIHAFVELYKKGLIYKGYRLVNWCPVSKSAISDEEVYYQEVEGKLWHFRYPITGTNEYLIVATTRPETMFGDTAVAVHPKDKRYRKYVGKTVTLPIVGREIPVIADDYVDMEFGTGVVKITPAHDPNDYEIGKKYNLEFINILNPDASLNDNVPEEFRGLDRFEAREATVEKLRALKCIEKIENYTHKVGYSERGHVPIEPYLSEQWFMKMGDLCKPATEAVKSEKIKFYPERWTKTYYHWMDNIRDWCISRQLWWGHRIPVWYCDECGAYDAHMEAPAKCPKCGGVKLRQDEDVLDTWASSWLWPFAVHQWPEMEENLKYYYPTDTLVTGPDIIFFWVARMIIAGIEFMGEIPFRQVYFTGIIRDEIGRKMSKSLGNSPDPLDVIREFGADSLRYTMMRLAPMGNDILYSNEKCEMGRNFGNKIWNSARFVFQNAEGVKRRKLTDVTLDVFDRWILSRVEKTAEKAREALDTYRFNDYTIALYDFLWGEFCDWYLEIAKVGLYQGAEGQKEAKVSVLFHVLDVSLRLLHPVMPHLTEKLYQALPEHEETIMRAPWPEAEQSRIDDTAENFSLFAQSVIYTVRNLRGENKIPPSANLKASVVVENIAYRPMLEEAAAVVKKLAKLEMLTVEAEHKKAGMEVSGSAAGLQVFLSLEGLVDVAKERERITQEIVKTQNFLEGTRKKLENEAFVSKAPPAVIRKEKDKIVYLENEIQKLTGALRDLG